MKNQLIAWIYGTKTGVQWLVFICILVFIPVWVLRWFDSPVISWFTFTPSIWVKPWSIITYMFLHVGFWHLLSNLLWLYFVGSILQDLVGPKHVMRLFLGGGILGALCFQLVYSFSRFSDLQIPMELLGASGGVSAIVIGTALFTPRYRLFLFGLIEVELRWIAVIKVVLDLMGLASGTNFGGYTAHMGGILWGVIYVYGVLKGDFLTGTFEGMEQSWTRLAAMFQKKSTQKPHLRFERGNKSLVSKVADTGKGPSEAEVNAILDKISQVGYNNLSTKEKETLFKASKKD